MARITMQQIAALAGLSLATVSRTIHSPHLVKPGTLEQVRRLMAKEGYVYNATAGDFSRRRSSVIGVIIPTTRGAIFANSTQGIQEKAQENGFSLIIGSTGYDAEAELKLLLQFQERRLAGIILTGYGIGRENVIKELVKSGIPCVVVWEVLKNSGLSFVGFSNFQAAFSMTDYLAGLNHRRIGLILGPYSRIGRARRRLEGYRSALQKNGLPFDPELVIETMPTLKDGKESMTRLLSMSDRPTAVFAGSDMLAFGAMSAARERGLRVPDDISVAGFDDIDFAAYSNPPLTTVRVPAREMGERAVSILVEMIEGKSKKDRRVELPTEIVIRESCREWKERSRAKTGSKGLRGKSTYTT
ncbi:MAG: LacI family transcriptional regulator [Deltaproteobacteria bacterium HGW-Deltaproteobacteria-15]|jgi:DNA-binding LacI/PurR family transcriptional regulator|nr:MAG: LacI family transcriptional regulator [Deltaproteobacteria bacterium HGW-Deltaproteobacteria-15]